jgi:uracil-DNA glycosylase
MQPSHPTIVPGTDLAALETAITVCRLCPRLVEWRERAAGERPRRFADATYWARPVPGFGDPNARILLVGLAPAAHGGNRTGRMFTGDGSANFLCAALHRAGLASQPASVARGDGLTLIDSYMTAVVRCAPPANRPTPGERDTCLPHLVSALSLLPSVRVIVALGSFAWDGALAALARSKRVPGVPVGPVSAPTAAPGPGASGPRPRFAHGAQVVIGPYVLLGSFHPSQQNTFTRRLLPDMLDGVLARAIELTTGRAVELARPVGAGPRPAIGMEGR